MKPLIVLLSAFGISLFVLKLITGQWDVLHAGNIAMCCMLLFTAMGHFVFTKGMVLMMPAAIPYKAAVIYITGVMEIIFGIGLLFNQTRYLTATLLLVFFIALLPANILAANKRVNIEKGDFSGDGLNYLWFRIPLQILFIGWMWFFSLS